MTRSAFRRAHRVLAFVCSPRFLILLLCVLILADAADAAKKKGKRRKPRYTLAKQEKPVGLRVDVQAVRDSISKQATTPAAQVDAALRLGSFTEDAEYLKRLTEFDPRAAWIARAQHRLALYRFADARVALDSLARYPRNDESRWLEYRWLLLREDLRTLDSLTLAETRANPVDAPALIARAELQNRLLRFEESRSLLLAARPFVQGPVWRARLILGLGKVLHREDRYQAAFDTLKSLIHPATLNDDILFNMSLALIALSRVGDAIDLLEEAALWNPGNEQAHYYLGNGYARFDYSQLAKHKKDFLANGAAAAELQQATAALRRGDLAAAREIANRLAGAHPRIVEPHVLLGAAAWTEAKFNEAADHFRAAIRILPEYGRARNGLAKSLEGLRMAQNIHRAEDSLAFTRKAMPSIPRIEEFVLNYTSLSPRHQKQVALAVEPWRRYVPVLVESGSRYYIKPLQDKLSECPGLETIRDQRIEYDSRLWDDVRGAGGFTTVTGIEDVERSIYSQYNTVLHELTHQVHGVFPPEDARRIEEAFNAARAAEDSGRTVFMSRYQQASVWEYFAEGANAYFSPRRDLYDTREVVRERLYQRDSTLIALVEHYVLGPNVEACYPVGLVNAAENALERQNPQEALGFAQKAYAHDPAGETALAELSRIYSLLDQDSLALRYADSLIARYPGKARSYISKAGAIEFMDGNFAAAAELLAAALNRVDSLERKDIRAMLGGIYWFIGRYPEAAAQHRAILAEVSDDPTALWDLGLALGDGGDYLAADSVFLKAIELRSGIVELRLDYARILMAQGRLVEAGKQIEEAQLLAPGDVQVLTMKGWYLAESEQWKLALAALDRALELGPDHRLAGVLRLKVMQHYLPPAKKRVRKYNTVAKEAAELAERAAKDVPTWVFLPRKSSYVPARMWPHFQKELLRRYAGQQ